MSTFSPTLRKGGATHAVLALVALAILIAVLAGVNERLGIGDSAAFWALFVVGMVICAIGPLGQGATFGWFNPLHIAGYVLGVLLLLLGAAVLFGIAIPGISSVQRAIVLLGALMVVKGVLAMFYRQQPS
jgi:hypothetical protein